MTAALLIDAPAPVQIATVLGLPRPASFDDLKIANAMAAGLLPKSVGAVAKWLSRDGGQVKPADLVPKSTLHRLTERDQRLGKEASETLWRVARVYTESLRLYRDPVDAVAFLMRPHPLLDGRVPFEVAKGSSAGANLVVDIMQSARYGLAV